MPVPRCNESAAPRDRVLTRAPCATDFPDRLNGGLRAPPKPPHALGTPRQSRGAPRKPPRRSGRSDGAVAPLESPQTLGTPRRSRGAPRKTRSLLERSEEGEEVGLLGG